MAMKLATAYVDITAKDAGFKRGIRDMRGEIQNQVGSLAGMLGQLGIGAALGAAAKGVLGLASEAEQSEVAFNVIIKDLEKTKLLLADLQEFSVVTPFTPREVRRAGQQLVQANTALEDVLPNIKMLGDLAAGGGGDMNELVAAFIKLRGEGKLTGEVEERFQTQRIMLRGLAEQAGITGAQWVEMRKKGELTFPFISEMLRKATSEGGTFFNAMKAQSTTAAGLWSTLTGGIQDLARSMGDVLMPAWKGFLSISIQVVDSIKAFNEQTGGLVAQIAVITSALTGLTTAVMAARTAMRLLGITYKTVLISTGWGAVIVALGAVIGLVYKLISALFQSDTVMESWKENVDKFGVAWTRIQTAATNAWNAIKQIAMNTLNAIFGFFGVTFDGMRGKAEEFTAGAIQDFANWVLNVSEWLQVFSENWGVTWELVKNGANIAFQFLKDLFTINLTTVIGYAIGRYARQFVDFWALVIKIAWKALKAIGSMLVQVFKMAWEAIKALFTGDTLRNVMQRGFQIMAKEANDFGKALGAGWRKENPFELLEMGTGLKAALAKQDELLGKLAGRKAELEAESRKMLTESAAAGDQTQPGKPEEKKAAPPPQEMLIKFESGMFGFGEIQKSIQDKLLEGEDTDKQMLKKAETAERDRKDMKRSLESIDDKLTETESPVAAG